MRMHALPIRIVLIATLIGSLALMSSVVQPQPAAAAYSCGDPANNHCYGLHVWNGGTSGAETKIRVIPGYYNSGYNFITNELWLADTNNPNCNFLVNNFCWVEGGYEWISGYNNYWWGDKRPGDSQIWYHFLRRVPGSDTDSDLKVSFWKNPAFSSFSTLLSSENYEFGGYSTSNTMVTESIHLGMELSGASGGTSEKARFTGNKWRDFNGWVWHYQASYNSDHDYQYKPPYLGWDVKPNVPNSEGGTMWTDCC